MTKSKNYFLNKLHNLVEDIRSSEEGYLFDEITKEDRDGMNEVMYDYCMSKFLMIGDTAFNRDGYRNATDKIIEHFKTNF